MPRLVRRAPLSERLKAYLDPLDWLMWISEELNSSDWEEFAQSYSLWLGFGMNLVFIVAQANAGASNSYDDDGVFREASAGWLNWFLNLLVLILGGVSFLNAGYTWTKKRHYRLFEQPIDSDLSTPSAQRVRVDSSPMTASPLRLLKNVLGASSAESRSHPDAGRDVWEIAVWDPNPLCLDIFCLFSPLHVILYYLNLPVAPLDPTPSVKVTMTLFIGFVLSLQLRFLRTSFVQQIKDNAIIHREVLHEYDNKFVHPTLQRQWRDVGIQTISKKRNRDSSVGVKGSSDDLASEVTTYTPTTIIKRPFRTNPNTNYASQYDPDNLTASTARLVAQTPSMRPGYSSAQYTSTSTATGADFSSPIRPSNTPNPFRPSQSHQLRPSGSGDGGSLGVFSHAASPLRKSASANFLRDGENGNTSNSRGRDSLGGAGERRIGSPTKREGSPLKRMSMPAQDRDKPLNQAERLGRGYGGLGVGRRESGRF